MTETSLALRGNTVITSFDDASRAAAAMAKSGYFQDSRDAAQALVKILAGQEMGFGPFASMTGIHVIQGKPTIGANLMAAAVKGSGRYNYRVTEMTDKTCSIDFYEGKDKIGTSTFTADDARKAGTKNMDKYARNMLFARAMSNGVRWYCPDAFNGATVYTPEEMGADVDEDGNVVTGSFVEPPASRPAAEILSDLGEDPEPSAASMSLETAEAVTNSEGERYGDLDTEKLSHMANAIQKAIKAGKYQNGDREAHLMKLDAIRVIMAARRDH